MDKYQNRKGSSRRKVIAYFRRKFEKFGHLRNQVFEKSTFHETSLVKTFTKSAQSQIFT